MGQKTSLIYVYRFAPPPPPPLCTLFQVALSVHDDGVPALNHLTHTGIVRKVYIYLNHVEVMLNWQPPATCLPSRIKRTTSKFCESTDIAATTTTTIGLIE